MQAQLLPQVSLSSNVEMHKQELRTSGFVPFNDDFNTQGFNLQLSQSLYNPQTFAAWQQERVDAERAEVQLHAVEQELMFQVASSYFDVMISQESVESVNAQMTAIARLYVQAKTAYRDGDAAIIDIDEIRSTLDSMRLQSVMAKSDLEVKKQRLRKLTGHLPARLANTLRSGLEVLLESEEMFLWEKKALLSSPAVRIAKLDYLGARKQVDVAESEYYPMLDLVISHNQNNRGVDHSLETIAALQLELPLYQGGATMARTREARANEEKMKYLLHDVSDQVILDVREAYLDVKNGRLLMHSAYQAFDSGQKLLDSTYQAFDDGIRGSLDILNAQLGLFESQREMVRSEYNFLTSILRLKLIAGVLVLADLREVDRFLDTAALPGKNRLLGNAVGAGAYQVD